MHLRNKIMYFFELFWLGIEVSWQIHLSVAIDFVHISNKVDVLIYELSFHSLVNHIVIYCGILSNQLSFTSYTICGLISFKTICLFSFPTITFTMSALSAVCFNTVCLFSLFLFFSFCNHKGFISSFQNTNFGLNSIH
jgi:hypothetical protein